MIPILKSDSYKQFHVFMYPKGITKLYSNLTPRSFKYLGCEHAVFFGLQYYLKKYLIEDWNENFFYKKREDVIKEFKRFHKYFSGVDIDASHVEALHKLGYMPILIKALPEGSRVKEKIPFFTITNTHPDFAWLVNFLETQISTVLWHPTVIATLGDMYRKLLNKWALKTTGSIEGVQWQGHDFSMRGLSSMESANNQAGWLLSFTGTDTIPAVYILEDYYNANMEEELIAASVPASEHSVMTSYGKENEIDAFKRLMQQFPTGILSIVSDSFDLWKVCTEFMVELKDEILTRNGKIVIRPDSGVPEDIICGFNTKDGFDEEWFMYNRDTYYKKEEWKGVIELLWDVFGGTINEQGYKVLDSHIGCIYGDSINLERAEEICKRLEAKGFASTNVVMGVGSYTMQYKTRDSLGLAVKSTYCEVDGQPREIFKDPITDDGVKKSAKGLLSIHINNEGEYYLKDQCTPEEEQEGCLIPVFKNGELLVNVSLNEIRNRLN